MGMLQIFRDDEKHRSLASARRLTKQRVEQRAEFFDALELGALLGDRLKQPDMFHAVKRRTRAFRRSGGVDVRRDDEQRHGFFVRLRDGGDDIGRAAAGGDQANRRLFGRARVAERHVAGAAFMLRVDEVHMRAFGDGVADRKRSMGEHAENMAHAS